MEFNEPIRNEDVSNFPRKLPNPLRAEGNLTYPEFITLVRNLWEEAHPDIPIRPVQSKKYARYPVIVYGLENRHPHKNEPKNKFREQVYQIDQDSNLAVYAQRFDNTVIFRVITENQPELCEAIIETFEDFMFELTPIFKKYGVSDFFYIRRLSDKEMTDAQVDTEARAVAYLVVLERVRVTSLTKLKEIVIRVRNILGTYYQGAEFYVDEDALADGFLKVPEHPYKVGDLVVILPALSKPIIDPDDIDRIIPQGLHHHYLYQVKEITDNTIVLMNLNGSPAPPRSVGQGRLAGVQDYNDIKVIIEDDVQLQVNGDGYEDGYEEGY